MEKQESSWKLIGWIVIPAVLAVGAAFLVLALLGAAPAAQSSGGAPAPPDLPTATCTAEGVAAGPPTDPPLTAPPPDPPPQPTATLPPPADPPLSSATPDMHALALLTELPSTLPGTHPAPPETASPPPMPTDAEIPPTGLPTALPPAVPEVSTVTPSPKPPPPAVPTASGGNPDYTGGGTSDPVTGLPADPAVLARPPLIVMIDNHPDAAPQSGLNEASMVIEALAEGGITRFETFFLSGSAPSVGPVRSARPYFVEWAYPFHALLTHCGGSWEAVDLIKEAAGILTNVDCFDGTMPFWRSNDRAMPHNLYSSTTQLWKLAARKNIPPPAEWPGFAHAAAWPAGEALTSPGASFSFSALSRSDVSWTYDPSGNRYLRQQWGYWHRDAATGEIVNAANVAILWTNVWALPHDTAGRMGTDTTGRGTALFLRDGQAEWGTWSRATPYTPLRLWDGKGTPMVLAPGRLWIEILGIGKKVTLEP